MANRCCACQDPAPSTCPTPITSADLGTLLYAQGLDANLCKKFQAIAELLQLRDCVGNILASNAQIVTCAAFNARLCAALATLAAGGSAQLGVTQLVGTDCLTYTIPETPLVANDSQSVDFTTSGAFGHTLTATVKISADGGNILVLHADGLYVPASSSACAQIAGFPAGAPAVLGVTPLVGSDCQTHVVPATPPTVLAVADTPSVDMTIAGAPGSQVISADVEISASPGNQVVINPDGLFVPAGTAVDVLVADTDCLDLSVVEAPAGTFTISGAPIVSAAPGNALSCTPSGLFATDSGGDIDIQVVDTDCIDLTVNEAPVGTFSLQADIVISGAPGNALECTPLGLFATGGTVVAQDTLGIDMTASTVGTVTTISADPIIADSYPGFPAGCNPLQVIADGLTVPPPSTGAGATLLSADTYPSAPILAGAVFVGPTTTLNVNNPSNCRSAIVVISYRHPGTDGTAGVAATDNLEVESFRSVNFPAVEVLGPIVMNRSRDSTPNPGQAYASAGSDFHFVYTVPPGFAGSFSEFIQITNNGPDTEVFVAAVRLNYWLFTI